jgi:hypothetical protein
MGRPLAQSICRLALGLALLGLAQNNHSIPVISVTAASAGAYPEVLKTETQMMPLSDKSGVEILAMPNGTAGIDNSGHGAVLCAWHFYMMIKNALDMCPADPDRKYNGEIAAAIGRINEFISINSPSHTPIKQLNDYVIDNNTNNIASFNSKTPEDQQIVCAKIRKKIDYNVLVQMRDGLQSKIDDLLSVPRVPVMNPCM